MRTDEFLTELYFELLEARKSEDWTKVDEILDTILDRIQLNTLKRAVYQKMKETSGEENKYWYNVYQQLKSGVTKELLEEIANVLTQTR